MHAQSQLCFSVDVFLQVGIQELKLHSILQYKYIWNAFLKISRTSFLLIFIWWKFFIGKNKFYIILIKKISKKLAKFDQMLGNFSETFK